jgi:hypothetical protein
MQARLSRTCTLAGVSIPCGVCPGISLALVVANHTGQQREAQGRNVTLIGADGLQAMVRYIVPRPASVPPGWYADAGLYPRGIGRVVAFVPWDRPVSPHQLWSEVRGVVSQRGLWTLSQGNERMSAGWPMLAGPWLRPLPEVLES